MNINDMRRELSDIKHVIDMICDNADERIVIAGGFARRFFMKENGIELLPSDDVECDIDIYIPVELMVDYFEDEELYLKIIDPSSEIPPEIVFSQWFNMSGFIHNVIKSPMAVLNTYVALPIEFRSLRFKSLNRKVEKLSTHKVDANYCRREAIANVNPFKFNIPVCDMVQFMVVESTDDTVAGFDIDQARFVIPYPFSTAKFVGEHSQTLERIYEIEDVSFTPSRFIKNIARMEKYSNYGFVYTPNCISNIISTKFDDVSVSDMVCYMKGFYE